jgi:hypothetical protein
MNPQKNLGIKIILRKNEAGTLYSFISKCTIKQSKHGTGKKK